MVGIFSKFSVIRSGHRRSQSALENRGVIPPNADAIDADHVASHGIQVGIEFKPVEHPIEPLDSDEPVLCSLPEPSILNVRPNLSFFLESHIYEFDEWPMILHSGFILCSGSAYMLGKAILPKLVMTHEHL